MDVMHERVAGLDVHKETVVACVRIVAGGKATRECRTFDTTTAGAASVGNSSAELSSRMISIALPICAASCEKSRRQRIVHKWFGKLAASMRSHGDLGSLGSLQSQPIRPLILHSHQSCRRARSHRRRGFCVQNARPAARLQLSRLRSAREMMSGSSTVHLGALAGQGGTIASACWRPVDGGDGRGVKSWCAITIGLG